MEKVLKTISECRNCSHSVLFVSSDAKFKILACTKTATVLKVIHPDDNYFCGIPEDCPLPDFKE